MKTGVAGLPGDKNSTIFAIVLKQTASATGRQMNRWKDG